MSRPEQVNDCAREAYLASRRQNEMLTLAEAAKMVDRSKSTVRKWIKDGQLTTEKRKGPRGGSVIVVSRGDLLHFAGTAGKSAKPSRRKSQPSVASPAVLQAELDGQKALVEALRSQLELQDSQLRLLEDSRRMERVRVDEWKDRWIAADAELRALRSQLGVPWWRRLLTMEVLPGPSFIPRQKEPSTV